MIFSNLLHHYHDDFYSFFVMAFEALNPGQKLDDIWHIRYLADILTDLDQANLNKLIINIPPRNLKSTLISVAWPAWLLGKNPQIRIIVASYSQKLSNKFSIDTRAMLEQVWFREIFPNLILRKDQNEKYKFTTTAHGFRLATSTGGTITGEGADILILDDPHNPKEIFSKYLRQKTIEWYEQIFSTRLNNRKNGKIILVMQRLHSQDLCAHLIQKGGYDLINIPIINNEAKIYQFLESKKYVAKDELLNSHRFDDKVITSLRTDLGDSAFSAQYLGNPQAEHGNILHYNYLAFTDEAPKDYEQIYQSWDSASCNNETSDYSVCTTWYIQDNKFYLVDVFRKKTNFIELKEAAIACYQKYRPDIILIEGKSSGLALIDELLNMDLPVQKITPKGDKISRLMQVMSFFETKKLVICKNNFWFTDLTNELLQFPQTQYDDQIDSITQFLYWYKNRSSSKIRIIYS